MNVGTRDRPTYLPAELLEVLPGQGFGGEPNIEQRQSMIQFSCRRPPQNYDSITTEGLSIMGLSGAESRRVGIRIPSKDMITVHGRTLPSPELVYGGRQKTRPNHGGWNLIRVKFSQCATIGDWACLLIRKPGTIPIPQAKRGMDAFANNLRNHGLTVGICREHVQLDIWGGKEPGEEKKNRQMLEEAFKQLSRYPFVVVLLPDADGKTFDYIKYIGDIKSGVLTHCMQAKKFKNEQPDQQYLSNNAMKVNLKLGGRNQVLNQDCAHFVGFGKTMVVGLDVTHPSGTDPEAFPSVAAIVASIDQHMSQWPGEVRGQTRRQEQVEYLREMMEGRLALWMKQNKGHPPENILIYRDGVSEGQYSMVLNEELPKVQEAAQRVYPKGEQQPNITIVVCGKRHNVRFYPTTTESHDRTSNPLNGCVVDRGVTRPIYWDFYLQAQAPLQGSARPAHYIVIHDEIFTNKKLKLSAHARSPTDLLQELTHNICYMMGRATRSISYCTPAFLADKFCDRARKYLLAYYHKHPAEIQEGSMFPREVLALSNRCLNKMVYI
jgi:eukaryotic translation initiation factor 2C